jgi:hypothetical protein
VGRKRRAKPTIAFTLPTSRFRAGLGKAIETYHFRPKYASANVDWIRKKASAILERVLRGGTERLRDQEKPYEDYRM